MTANNSTLGTYLVDGDGMTLYYFAADVPLNGFSACTSPQCLGLWTPFYTRTISVDPPLVATDFSYIIPPTGTSQTAYRAWPLYLYMGDTKPGDINGDGYNNVWYVMKPDYTTVIIENGNVGRYLADGTGKTLYSLTADSSDMSACTGACLTNWPIFYSDSTVIPSGLANPDFTAFIRTDGSWQSAYRGMPLYYFSADAGPGETSGNKLSGYGGTFNVVPPA